MDFKTYLRNGKMANMLAVLAGGSVFVKHDAENCFLTYLFCFIHMYLICL